MKRHAAMNRIYRLVWSRVSNAWVAVAENAKGRGKAISGRKLIAAALALTGSGLLAPLALAAPTGGQISAGAGSIAQTGANTTITQSSQNLAINWQGFSIAADEAVRFNQPNATAIALNRVLGQDPSQILGSLSANGQVFILNPNGVLFGTGSQVNVGGLVASTLSLSDADFMAGKHTFSNGGTAGAVANQGTLTAAQGGYIALLAPEVRNEGVISATLGTALLAAGDKVTLTLNNGSLLAYSIDQGSLNALAENKQLIQADGGQVFMSAKAANALSTAMVNNTGIIEARTVQNVAGVIMLMGDMQVGTVNVGGSLDVSSATGEGGRVVATGWRVLIDDGARLDASGATGGGEVYVGGGWEGKDASIANASAVVMRPGAVIDVSATESGNGGTAVLWSQDYTGFYGNIAAKGGPNGGNGGKVETSSHNNLQALGQVDASAANGLAGSWLLDPFNVTIASTGASGTAYANPFTPTADSTILASSISTSLSQGTSVTITTGTTGPSAGDITVNAAITQNNDWVGPTLTLKAANNINVNAAISGVSGAGLNVVLTADADGSGAGDINFGAGGRISTIGYNFSATGQNLTMAAGSFIDVSTGTLDINVNGAVTLAGNSLQAQNNGWDTNPLSITSASIATSNTVATTPDIVTTTKVALNAGTIGSAVTPIKISAGASPSGGVLSIVNTTGNSYVNEIGQQAFGSIDMTIGSQANSTQNVQIMGDAGGDGTTGTGHVILLTDVNGVLNIATNNIKTAGGGATFATQVSVTAPNMTFADGSVNTGTASFTASASGTMRSIQVNGIGDISAPTVSLNGPTIGISTNPLELGIGSTLNVNNTGGSTFIKSVSNDYTNIFLTNVKAVGTHAILFNDSASATVSDGDHIDYTTNGTDVFLPTISGGASDGVTFGSTTGIDVTRRNRNVTLTAASGNIIFDNNSVNTRAGHFTAQIPTNNPDGDIAALNAYNSSIPAAQITAGDVTFNVYNSSTPAASTIGAGGKDIQIAQGAGTSNNTLTVNTQQGGVTIHELSPNHFKTLNVTLNSPSAAQNVAIDLNGADDVNFSDSGSLVLIDATKVNLSANNRNWNLSTPDRSIQINGTSLGSGYYTINAGKNLRLNADVLTNGGDISLTGQDYEPTRTGIHLLKAVRVDSNADDTANVTSNGASGQITMTGMLLSRNSGDKYALTVDSSSSTQGGGQIVMYSGANNNSNGYTGDYLTGLTLTSKGSTNINDGNIYINWGGTNYYLNGNFSSTGNSYLGNPTIIDTEQGNLANGGNINFSGQDLSADYWSAHDLTFNTATTAAGKNGGNVDLFGTFKHSTLSSSAVTVNTVGGASGTAGSISLPAVTTYHPGDFGYSGIQSYTGGIITLNGNLTSNQGAVILNGDTRLAANVVIDTWQHRSDIQTGTAGAVTIGGVGVSAIATGKNLTIDTSTDTGAGYFDPDNIGSTALYTHNGGNVTVAVGNAGGAYVNTLVVNTSKGGTRNTGGGVANGTIALNTVGTEGSQTYIGGATTVSGSLTTNGGNIGLAGVASLALSGSPITFDTDRIGGSNNAGSLLLGAHALNGPLVLTIDTTADGGGVGTDLTLINIGNTTPFSSVNVAAKALTVSTGGVKASGNITLEARGALSDLTLNTAVTSSLGNIVLAAGQNFINNVGTTALSSSNGRWLVYSTSPLGSFENGLTAVAGSTLPRLYNRTYLGNAPATIAAGNHLIYSAQPTLTVTADNKTRVYGAVNPAFTSTITGFVVDDGVTDTLTTAGLGGAPVLTSLATATSTVLGSPHAITPTAGTLASSAGYAFGFVDGSLTITPATLTLGGTRVYNGLTAYAGSNLTATGVNGETFTMLGNGASGNLASANVQTGSTLASLAGLTLGTGSGGGLSSNYNALSTGGSSVNVTAANLTVTADNKNRLYGGVNPILTSTVSGFVNGETAGTAAGFGGAANATTAAGATTPVGTAVIAAGAGNLTATNYVFTNLVNGTLTINPAEIITSPVGGILPAVVEAIIALPGGADLLPAFSSTVTVAATQIGAIAPQPALSNLQYVYMTTTTSGTLSGDIDTTVDGEAVPTKVQGTQSDGFNERLRDAPIQFTGTVLVRNGGINLPSDADDANERNRKRGNK